MVKLKKLKLNRVRHKKMKVDGVKLKKLKVDDVNMKKLKVDKMKTQMIISIIPSDIININHAFSESII